MHDHHAKISASLFINDDRSELIRVRVLFTMSKNIIRLRILLITIIITTSTLLFLINKE